eukprot:1981271-Rhodomonas_salina.2
MVWCYAASGADIGFGATQVAKAVGLGAARSQWREVRRRERRRVREGRRETGRGRERERERERERDGVRECAVFALMFDTTCSETVARSGHRRISYVGLFLDFLSILTSGMSCHVGVLSGRGQPSADNRTDQDED